VRKHPDYKNSVRAPRVARRPAVGPHWCRRRSQVTVLPLTNYIKTHNALEAGT